MPSEHAESQAPPSGLEFGGWWLMVGGIAGVCKAVAGRVGVTGGGCSGVVDVVVGVVDVVDVVVGGECG